MDRMKPRPLFKHPMSPDMLYNRWLSWLPLVVLVGLCVLGVIEMIHAVSPEEAISSHCQMAAGKCYPQP